MRDLGELHQKNNHTQYRDNFTKNERVALKELKTSKNIVVHSADKWGNIIVLDAG